MRKQTETLRLKPSRLYDVPVETISNSEAREYCKTYSTLGRVRIVTQSDDLVVYGAPERYYETLVAVTDDGLVSNPIIDGDEFLSLLSERGLTLGDRIYRYYRTPAPVRDQSEYDIAIDEINNAELEYQCRRDGVTHIRLVDRTNYYNETNYQLYAVPNWQDGREYLVATTNSDILIYEQGDTIEFWDYIERVGLLPDYE